MCVINDLDRFHLVGEPSAIWRALARIDEALAKHSGVPDRDFDALFTTDKPVIFAFHGYPWLIHRLTYRRRGHDNIHVRG